MGIREQAEMLLRVEQTFEGADPIDVSAVVFELWRTRGKHLAEAVLTPVITPPLTPDLTPEPVALNTPTQVFSAVGGHYKGGRSRSKVDPVKQQQSLEILEFLNLKAGRSFRPVEENLRYIRARLNTATPEDLKGVIARKTREWKNTEMAKYLRPATLLNATKFEQYMGEQGT